MNILDFPIVWTCWDCDHAVNVSYRDSIYSDGDGGIDPDCCPKCKGEMYSDYTDWNALYALLPELITDDDEYEDILSNEMNSIPVMGIGR